jgi:hypothetical protein
MKIRPQRDWTLRRTGETTLGIEPNSVTPNPLRPAPNEPTHRVLRHLRTMGSSCFLSSSCPSAVCGKAGRTATMRIRPAAGLDISHRMLFDGQARLVRVVARLRLREALQAPSLAPVIATLGQATEDPIKESGWAYSKGRIPLQRMRGSRCLARPWWDRGQRVASPCQQSGVDHQPRIEEQRHA